MKPEILYEVKAQRGDTLRCKGWKQETLLRMLENNMENAEAPEYLVIYGGIGKCARNWESYHAIVDSLKNLENDETLVVQSGMPVAIFKTHKLAPRVVMATTNIMKATWPIFYDLQDKNLTLFAQYTAAPWEYIGTQGVIQGTFETLGAIADQHFDGSLVGRILLTAGHGGMGANQPRAMNMHGGVCIDVDVNEAIIDKRIRRKKRWRSALWAMRPRCSGKRTTRASNRISSPKCAPAMTRFPTSRRGFRRRKLKNCV
jgi:urocanate hydratase